VEWFPALAGIPRVTLGTAPTPVARLDALVPSLWIKRDDRFADPLGGNKARALEFLLGSVKRGERIVTVGSAGSTHALAVATYGSSERVGARVLVGRWRQEMNTAAERVAHRIPLVAERAPLFWTLVEAYAWAGWQRLRGARWIPAGGSSPLGVLGHVNAGLELVRQIDAGRLPTPASVVVPLGTGGTAAGLALAFATAKRDIVVTGARVVPRIVARRRHVLRLADRTRRLIERITGRTVQSVAPRAVEVVHETYGGAYGRETKVARAAANRLEAVADIALDPTYSAKAFALALERATRGPTLFWLTFDPRILRGPDR
jgi:D-cysteine desulfhydrase